MDTKNINQHVVRNVRIDIDLDNSILAIAKYEDRTISKTIQRLLQKAVNDYFRENPEVSDVRNGFNVIGHE